MHDIKFIKDNSSLFDEILKKRNISLLKDNTSVTSELFRKLKKNTKFTGKEKFFIKKFSPKLSQKDLEKIKNDVAKIKIELDELKKITSEKEKILTKFFLKFQI